MLPKKICFKHLPYKFSMFFILSKLLQFLIDPFVWIFVLLLISFFARDYDLKRRAIRWTVILTIFFSNSFIFSEFSRAWETPATHYDSLKVYDAGIVLGGMLTYDKEYDRIQFNRGTDRLLQAIELYKKGIIKKVVFTGGSGSISHPEIKEGPLVERYLLTLGIPREAFLIEGESNNTHENAVFTKALLDEKKLEGEFLLITAAFHMRRGSACFEKVGIKTAPYSADRYVSQYRNFTFDHLFMPHVTTIDNFRNLIHEIVGFVVYKVVGYA